LTPRRVPGRVSAERLSVVAHELRSPVAALSALAAAAPGVPAAERRRLLLLGLAAARDVERILGDEEIVSVRREPVDLGSLAETFSGESVRISVLGPATVRGDPTRLRQLIANLVADGLRHGTVVVIDVSTRDGSAIMEVADDGPGVARGIDPFARGASDVGSSGLGLWLGRAIAEAHGGSLELVPDTGPGARFRLALPSACDAG
jgi:two-component system OmpR family sensor kinase